MGDPLPLHVRMPPPLKLGEDMVEEWKMFKQQFKCYQVISSLNTRDKEYQCAVFLHCAGTAGIKIYNGLEFAPAGPDSNPPAEDKEDLPTIIRKFDQYIIGEINETYERYMFNKREQKVGESAEAYISALRDMANTCNFCNCLKDSLIRDRLVVGIRDNATRKRLLQKRNLGLAGAVDICKGAEATQLQLEGMGASASVSAVKSDWKLKGKKSTHTGSKSMGPEFPTQQCKFCAKNHVMRKEKCPAWGKTCSKCNKRNHFSVCCPPHLQKKVHAVDRDIERDDNSSEEEYLVSVVNDISQLKTDQLNLKEKKGPIYAEMILLSSQKTVKFQVDCGAEVNIISKKYVQDVALEASNITLQMWNGETSKVCGKVRVSIRNSENKKKYSVEFQVVNEDRTPLISRKTAESMNLITVNYDNFKLLHGVTENNFLSEFSDVITNNSNSLGTLPGTVHFTVDKHAEAKTVAPRRIPIGLKQKLKDKLSSMVSSGVIAEVDEPTDWVSQMTITMKKNNDIRVCLDPQALNRALKREIYPLPVIDDVLPDLANAKVFTKVDLQSGYWHCILDEESSNLTTFVTPFGRYKWLRLPFGLNVSSEIFQKRLNTALEGLENVICVADDIIVYGAGANLKEATEDHDKKLKCLLLRCREKGIRLNRSKCQFRANDIPFLGHRVTSDGLKIDTEKVEAITGMENPKNTEEVQRLQGTVNYLARFLPKLSDVMEPIRRLTRPATEWKWTEPQETAMREIKRLVTEAPVLAFYDPSKELAIECDASQYGLGAVLMQLGRPIAYASRALTPTEVRYAQIEKEMLAIVFALERFHQYSFARKTIVYSDHKPLESIITKPMHRAPRRLQGMLMRIHGYNVEIRYQKGVKMYISDMLSRAYLPHPGTASEFEQVNMVGYLPIRPERLKLLIAHTESDEALQLLKTVIKSGWPEEKHQLPTLVSPYHSMRDELTIQDGIIFRGERVVVPESLRNEMKSAIHQAHLGTESCLRRARECLYWPGMNAEMKDYISKCEICRTFEISNQKETLMPQEIPSRPWEKVGTDLFSLEGQDFLITVDYLSNFWEVDRLNDTKSTTIIRKLKTHFARNGIPNTVVSDNGPQYVSADFLKFAQEWDFEHVVSSPSHQNANGKAEAAVKMAKRTMRKCKEGNTEIYKALLEIRNTPSQGIGSSPAQRLLGRRTRSFLPTTTNLLKPRGDTLVSNDRKRMEKSQVKQSHYYDKTAKDLPVLNEGDIVRMKPFQLGEKRWEKAIVNKRLDERSYEVETERGTFRRNRVHLKGSNEQSTKPVTMSPIPKTIRSIPISPPIQKNPEMTPEVQKEQVLSPSPDCNKQTISTESARTRSGREVKTPSRYADYTQ